MPNYPLEGLKVLDLSRVVAGPFATRMLADMGADVVKIEGPDGDISRFIGKEVDGLSGMYFQQNIGKRNVCIDFKVPGARELVLKLAKHADLLVENFRPGVMDRIGLSWEDLKSTNPKLVMLSISGFGQTGPERNRAAYAPTLHAETGLISRQAVTSGSYPSDIKYSIADTYSGLHGLVAAFAALRHAEKTGEGQHIDIAMINVMHATDDYAHWQLDGAWKGNTENGVWEAPEGRHIVITGDNKWLWHQFSNLCGLTAEVPEGAELQTKLRIRREAMAEFVRGFPTFEALTDQLDAINQPWGKVREFGSDAYNQESVKQRGVLVDVNQANGETRTTVQSPYKFSLSDSGITPDTNIATYGENNYDALEDWIGMNADEVDQLKSIGILHDAASISAPDQH